MRLSIRKRTALHSLAAGGLALIGALLLARIVFAASGVTIISKPLRVDSVYFDANNNGINEPDEFIADLPVFNGNEPLTFSWEPYPFPAGVNGSYRVAIWQNTTPLAAQADYKELKIGHHWASNPNRTTYTYGSFPNDTCKYCPTIIVIQPETYQLVQNERTGVYEYAYTPVGAALTNQDVPPGGSSDPFIFEIIRINETNSLLACTGQYVSEYCIPDCQEIWEFIYPSYEACIADCIDFFDDEIDIQNIYSCTCPYDDSDAGWDAGDAACQVYGDDFYFDPYSCTCYEDFECEVLCGELTAPTFSFGHNR